MEETRLRFDLYIISDIFRMRLKITYGLEYLYADIKSKSRIAKLKLRPK